MSEERARRMGWVPKEDFRGDPDKWVDADTFVDRGENIMPVLKENLERMEGKYGELQGRFEEQTSKLDKVTNSLEKLAEWHKGTAKRSYERAMRDLKKRARQAVSEGDTAAYDQVEAEMNDLVKENTGMDSPAQPQAQDMSPDFPEWQRQNIWYGQDDALTAFANGIAPVVANENPGIKDKDFYEEIARRTKDAFPQKFANPKKDTPPAVEGGGGESTGDRKTRGWKDLPAEAKSAYNTEFSGIPGFTKEQYAKDYFDQED